MNTWKAGQRVVCNRPQNSLVGCFIRSAEGDSIVIFCPRHNTIICGQRKNLEKLGWRLEISRKITEYDLNRTENGEWEMGESGDREEGDEWVMG